MAMEGIGPQWVSSYYDGRFLDSAEARSPEALGRQFEAILYRMLLKESRDAELETPLLDGEGMRMAREMRDDELAEQLGAMGQLGMARLIAEEIQDHPSTGLLKR